VKKSIRKMFIPTQYIVPYFYGLLRVRTFFYYFFSGVKIFS